MGLVYGLYEAKHSPVEPWWNKFTIRNICIAYQVKEWLLRLPRRLEDDAGSKPIGAETKSERSCMGPLLKATSMLSATLFGKQHNIVGRPLTLDRPPEHKDELIGKQAESMSSSTMTNSEVGSKREHDRPRVENMDSAALDLVSSGLENPSYTEVAVGPDVYDVSRKHIHFRSLYRS